MKELYLFGSYARGEATESRDLDFLVYGEGYVKPIMQL
ncbi:MAG: nucleotidyltransferase domain-containing protein [Lachnospiraceae bacterium]|nr:nucleotidyltransferase domain-containing protein [Lachnospiraceae bacterium]